jgi:aminopeptidase-like protein
MANNECSGRVLLSALIRYVKSMGKRRYTYRFVLNPETIGAITYLSRNLEELKKHVIAGIVLSCVGDERDYSILESKYADTLADKSLKSVLAGRGRYTTHSFLKRGSDERQYNAPGIDLPVVGYSRTKYHEYPEYHTSADDMNLITPAGLQGSYETLVRWIYCMENNRKYTVNVLGEPQLGKRGLYPTISQKGSYDEVAALVDFIAYADGRNDLFDLSRLTGVAPYHLVPIAKTLEENDLIRGQA